MVAGSAVTALNTRTHESADGLSISAGVFLAALVLWLYRSVLAQMALQWWRDPNYSHGFVVVVVVGYVVYQRRLVLRQFGNHGSNVGLAMMVAATVFLLAGTLGAELFVARTSILIMLAGLILFLAGWSTLRALTFPLGFSLLMIPLPALIYNEITFPLQLLASRLAAGLLEFVGVPVLREGNVLVLPNYSLEVVEACSGIRSLMSLMALAIAYGYFAERRLWVRLVLVALMLPLAVISNAVRVLGAGLLTYTYGPSAAEGFFHLFQGWLIFLSAVVGMLLCHWLLSRIKFSIRKAEA